MDKKGSREGYWAFRSVRNQIKTESGSKFLFGSILDWSGPFCVGPTQAISDVIFAVQFCARFGFRVNLRVILLKIGSNLNRMWVTISGRVPSNKRLYVILKIYL
jgi:hypothetical protein